MAIYAGNLALGSPMSLLSFRTPLETIHILVTDNSVTLTAPQNPSAAEWAAAYSIVRDTCDLRPELYFRECMDVYVYRRK